MTTTTRLPGHELRNEGAAFVWQDGQYVRDFGNYTGRGVCSCGAMSLTLDSNNARKRWHRQHKDEIRQAGGVRG